MSSSHGWRKHDRESVALTIVLFQRSAWASYFAGVVCPSRDSASCPCRDSTGCPSRRTSKAAEATKPAEEQPAGGGAGKMPVRPPRSQGASPSLKPRSVSAGSSRRRREIHIQKQVDAFMKDCPPIKVTLREIFDELHKNLIRRCN